MAILAQVPEYQDAGLWYAVEAVTDDDGTHAPIEGDYCAQYADIGGTLYAVVRLAAGTTIPPSAVPVAEVISGAFAAGAIPADLKFYARLGGR